ncbi:MAG: septal ring factor EnvC (AmiA/AmiB activator) [Parasphingorhabdus sp.]
MITRTCRFHLSRLTCFIAFVTTISWETGFTQTSTQQLESLRQEIKSLSRSLRNGAKQQDTLGNELEEIERQIQSLSLQQGSLAADLDQSFQTTDRLNREISELEQGLPEQKRKLYLLALAKQRLKGKSRLQILLDTDRPKDLQRTLKFYDYIAQDLIFELKVIQSHLNLLGKKQTARQQESHRILELQQTAASYKAELRTTSDLRQTKLKSLNQRIDLKNRRLEEKLLEHQQLKKLVSGLQSASEKHPQLITSTDDQQATSASLPLSGTTISGFRHKNPDTGIASTGMILAASSGADVRSVSGGQVVFSDWFRGFGLLLVVDHGNGVMSLYGFLSELLLRVGDKVERGTLIARVGNTGGQQQSSLYFEIRHNGNPINPAQFITRH